MGLMAAMYGKSVYPWDEAQPRTEFHKAHVTSWREMQ